MEKGPLQGKRVLVAPLDWGLGHATRCMPVIDLLTASGAEVIIGGEGRSLLLLRSAYPALQTVSLPEYKISYSRNSFMVTKTLMQTPRLLGVFKQEHRRLEQIIKTHNIDAVISDNRYGLWSTKIPCVFICHQLALVMPAGMGLLRRMVYKAHLRAISRFNYLWIPDLQGEPNLSGSLSHLYRLPANARFIGPQSRFKGNGNGHLIKGRILILLSGPEPQRTILEEMLLKQINDSSFYFLIVRGVTESAEVREGANYKMYNFLNGAVLEQAILESEVVIARPGYSTIMDLSVLQKKAVFIPTPGQTEQEYLSKILSRKGYVCAQHQHDLDIRKGIMTAKNLPGLPSIAAGSTYLVKAVEEWLNIDMNG